MQILFNGKSYASLDEMPANERQAYENLQQIFVDANGNGIPDFMEGDVARKVMSAFTSTNVADANGRVYTSLEELPPEVREKVERAFSKLSQLGIIVPASFPTDSPPPGPASGAAFEPAFGPSKPLIPQEPTIQESGGRTWLFLLLSALILCGLAGLAVYLFLR